MVSARNSFLIVVHVLRLWILLDKVLAENADDSTDRRVTTLIDAAEYLMKYKYINVDDSNSPLQSPTMDEGIAYFQACNGLYESGKLDDSTLELMNRPRCGNPDVTVVNLPAGVPHALQDVTNKRWPKSPVTYRISKYPSCFNNRAKMHQLMAKAFKVWSSVINLNFTHTHSEQTDIDIRFERSDHEDNYYSPGIIYKDKDLGHVVFNNKGGCDIHFNDEQSWTIDKGYGKDLFQMAVHEIGHCLDLEHDSSITSWMYYTYRTVNPNMTVSDAHKQKLLSLYGKSLNGPREPPKYKEQVPDLCEDSSVDALIAGQDKVLYVFKGDFYWEVTESGIPDDFPRSISEDWPGLHGNVDAAFVGLRGKFYFFKGHQYWRFVDKTMEPGYPKTISVGFPGIPNDVEAAFRPKNTGTVYFFKGDRYWVYRGTKKPHVDSSYGMLIDWSGLKTKVDAALQWHDRNIYFFKGQYFYKWQKKSILMKKKDVLGPYFIKFKWFNC